MYSKRYKTIQWWFVGLTESHNPTSLPKMSYRMVDAVRAYSKREAMRYATARNSARRWQSLGVHCATEDQYDTALQARALRNKQIAALRRLVQGERIVADWQPLKLTRSLKADIRAACLALLYDAGLSLSKSHPFPEAQPTIFRGLGVNITRDALQFSTAAETIRLCIEAFSRHGFEKHELVAVPDFRFVTDEQYGDLFCSVGICPEGPARLRLQVPSMSLKQELRWAPEYAC